ncbi:MAG: acetaldehyde dehydrogenase (acetylating) [Clostridia bacterium]|nr:acetaldehyde dehydrogenase (acetylating) [Clostridia bacterium]
MAVDAAVAIARAQELLDKAYAAQKQYANFDQDRVDRIIANMAKVGYENAERLARMAVDETKIGKYEDKIVKNRFASKNFYDSIKDMKTAGIIARDPDKKVIEIAAPMGVVTAIIPTTNPTSTVIFKCMASLKSRNAVVISPHPRAIACCMETARLMEEAAVAAGAPAGLIQCLDMASMDAANELMHNDKVAVILATGGTGLVKAAYSSGKPAYGVGPGNVPAYIERSADISLALDKILASKTFDNGTICASEQSIIVEKVIYDQAKALLKEKGGYFVTGEDAKKLSATVIKPNGGVNADVVGKAPQVIADLAGISMPEGTRVFVVELDKVGTDTPLSAEKLCPVLAFYTVENWVEACELCMELLEFGGLGHSLSIHSNNDEIIEQFGLLKPVSRILVNSPSSQGGIGYTTGLNPSLTLGCGTFGGNIASENITPLHLMNKKRIAYYNAPADFVLPTVSPVRQTGYSHEDIVAAVERALKNL